MKTLISKEEILKDIYKNHNHSWSKEVELRNKDNLSHPSMFYRGTYINYEEFFNGSNKFAKALKANGINKGDEFVAILKNTPEYPMLFKAASEVGAIVNFANAAFNKDYLSEIISRANANFVLVNEEDFASVADVLRRDHNDKKIVVLPMEYWSKYGNPYSEITDKFYKFDKEAFEKAKVGFNNLIDEKEFLTEGENYNGIVDGKAEITDPVAITYSSGSTKKGYHKGIVQRNETYIIMGRYHDSEVAGIPSMKNTVTLPIIGPHADTTLMSGVSDTMLQGGIIALDPIIDEYYFPYSLKINKAGLVIATRTYWIRALKETYENPELKGLKLPYLYVPSEGGEPLSAGEEKALNRWLFDVDAGVAVTHTPKSIVKMSVGGGDSEHGSLFLSLYRGYRNILQKPRGIHEPAGLEAYDFADVQILRDDGTYCDPMEMGRMVANAPISMKQYHNEPEATEKYFIKDAYGKVWGDLGTYGYVDKYKQYYIKGRIGTNDPVIKNFEISDVILRDTKNIMSCEVIDYPDYHIAHLEMQYGKKVNIEKTLLSAEARCNKVFGNNLKIYFRVRDHIEGFPTLFTAKRNMIELREEGLTEKCIIPSEYYKKDNKVKKLTF